MELNLSREDGKAAIGFIQKPRRPGKIRARMIGKIWAGRYLLEYEIRMDLHISSTLIVEQRKRSLRSDEFSLLERKPERGDPSRTRDKHNTHFTVGPVKTFDNRQWWLIVEELHLKMLKISI